MLRRIVLPLLVAAALLGADTAASAACRQGGRQGPVRGLFERLRTRTHGTQGQGAGCSQGCAAATPAGCTAGCGAAAQGTCAQGCGGVAGTAVRTQSCPQGGCK